MKKNCSNFPVIVLNFENIFCHMLADVAKTVCITYSIRKFIIADASHKV